MLLAKILEKLAILVSADPYPKDYGLSQINLAIVPKFNYPTRAIIGRSRFEAALVYKPRILGLKSEEFPFLVHKLSVI